MLFVSMVMGVSVCANARVVKMRTKRMPTRDLKAVIVRSSQIQTLVLSCVVSCCLRTPIV